MKRALTTLFLLVILSLSSYAGLFDFTGRVTNGCRDAFSQIEGESVDVQNGTDILDVNNPPGGDFHLEASGKAYVGFIDYDKDYIVYKCINFGNGAKGFTLRTSSPGTGGSKIEIRFDSLDSNPVGVCDYPPEGTGGWGNWKTINCEVSVSGGNHDLYFSFLGNQPGLLDVDWFKFTTETPVQQKPTCKDSDDGKDYYVQGSVTEVTKYTNWRPNTVYDSCNSDDPQRRSLAEAYCQDLDETYSESPVVYAWYDCPNGCSNGACLREIQQPMGKPDFEVTSISVSNENPKINEVVKVKFTVRNNGADFSGATTQYGGFDYVLNRTDSLGTGTMAGGWIQNLNSVESTTLSFDAYILSEKTTFNVAADTSNFVDEVKEDNNEKSVTIYSAVGEVSTQSPDCIDSDGGLNYYVSGFAGPGVDENSIQWSGYGDICSNLEIYDDLVVSGEKRYYQVRPGFIPQGKYLFETYCKSLTEVTRQRYECPNGCNSGACLGGTPQGPPETCPSDQEIEAQFAKCRDAGVDYIKKANQLGCIVVECQGRGQEGPSEEGVVPKLRGIRPEAEQQPLVCNGCSVDNRCLPYGTRKTGQFCDIDGEIKNQQEENLGCSNSYECRSNVCVNDQCVSGGLLQKFLNWLSSFFGG